MKQIMWMMTSPDGFVLHPYSAAHTRRELIEEWNRFHEMLGMEDHLYPREKRSPFCRLTPRKVRFEVLP